MNFAQYFLGRTIPVILYNAHSCSSSLNTKNANILYMYPVHCISWRKKIYMASFMLKYYIALFMKSEKGSKINPFISAKCTILKFFYHFSPFS